MSPSTLSNFDKVAIRWAIVSAGLAGIVYALGHFGYWSVLSTSWKATTFITGGLPFVLFVLLAAWGGWRSRSERQELGSNHVAKLSSVIILIGLVCGALGTLLHDLKPIVHLGLLSAPRVIDSLYLLMPVLLLGGIACMPTRPLSACLRARVGLDALVALVAAATLSWYFYLGPVALDHSDVPNMRSFVTLALPFVHIVLFAACLILSAQMQLERFVALIGMLTTGIVLFLTVDTWRGMSHQGGFYVETNPINALFIVPFALLCLSARSIRIAEVSREDLIQIQRLSVAESPSLRRTLLPYAFVLIVGFLAAYLANGTDVDQRLARGVFAGGLVLVSIVIGRQVIAIRENARLYAELQVAYDAMQRLAYTDGLTGVLNHRHFVDQASERLEASKKLGWSCAMIFLDIDYFKAYNDNHGHPAGDELLVKFAALLRTLVRDVDVVGRWGGEEFAIFLPGVERSTAAEIAERIRATIATTTFGPRAVTASLGVAAGPAETVTVSTLVDAADRCVYAAKRGGRNRVCVDGRDGDPAPTEPTKSIHDNGSAPGLTRAA